MLKTASKPSTVSGNQTILNGDLIIGTAGEGVDFSAVSNPSTTTGEVLTNYAEGTHIVADLSGAALTFTANGVATFTRIGRLVTLIFDITFPVTANASLALMSLPVATGFSPGGCGTLGLKTLAGNIGINCQGGPGGNGFRITDDTGNFLTNADLSGIRLAGQICYHAA